MKTRALILGSVVALAGVASAQETTTYEYDAQGRLTKSSKSGGPSSGTEKCISYDEAGNRTNHTVDSAGCSSAGGSVNNPPNAVNNSATAPYLYATTYLNVTANDSDPDGDSLTVIAVTNAFHAAVSIHSNSTIKLISLAPGTGYATYTVSDGNGGTDTATVTYTVPSGGGIPFFSQNGPKTDPEGSPDSDPDEGSTETGE